MRATVLYGAGDVRIEHVPDARLIEPTDALVTVSRACICGSDLWPYTLMEPGETARRMGHEAIGVVEAVGSGVRTLKVDDVVVMPFAYSDGTCAFCHEGLHTSCIRGGFSPGGKGDSPTSLEYGPAKSGIGSRARCPCRRWSLRIYATCLLTIWAHPGIRRAGPLLAHDPLAAKPSAESRVPPAPAHLPANPRTG
jgi:hypothetical protein